MKISKRQQQSEQNWFFELKHFCLIVLLLTLVSLNRELRAENALDEASDFKTSAEYRLRYQFDSKPALVEGSNSVEPGSASFVKQRFKLDLDWRRGNPLSAKLSLLNNMKWGNRLESSGAGTRPGVNGGIGTHTGQANTAVEGSDNLVTVNNAYLLWVVNENIALRFGRGPLFSGDGSVFGLNDWEDLPYAFDGLILTYETDFARFGFGALKIAEYQRSTQPIASHYIDDPEQSLYGLSVDFKDLPDVAKSVSLHLIQVLRDEQGADPNGSTQGDNNFETPSANTLRYGATVGGGIIGFDYTATFSSYAGKAKLNDVKVDETGLMFDVKLGYTFVDFMKSRLYFNYHYDSGDDGKLNNKNERYDPFYYEEHENAGLMDIVAWGNLTSYSFGLTLEPQEELKAGLHYHLFRRTETNDIVAPQNGRFQTNGAALAYAGASDLANSETNNSDDLGSEFDLTLEKSYQVGITILAQVGAFLPGEYLKQEGRDKTYFQYLLQGRMNF